MKKHQSYMNHTVMRKIKIVMAFVTVVLLAVSGWAVMSRMGNRAAVTKDSGGLADASSAVSEVTTASAEITSTITLPMTAVPESSNSAVNTPEPTPTLTPTPEPTLTPVPAETTAKPHVSENGAPDLSGYVVVIDPGHQAHANSGQEAIAPPEYGISGTKDKCSSGTSGVSTGRSEYKVNLEIGLKLAAYLESLGCEVHMTRTENDVDISNIERAEIALSYSPDVYIRLHCDGSDDSSARGIGVFVTDMGPYADSLGDWGDMLGECLSDSTGSSYRGCWASSTYSGLNWAADVPSFLLEMGFMSNSTDDELLSDPDYQDSICEGIAVFVSEMPNS